MTTTRVFFTGASGVGKSTLADWVGRSFGIPVLRDLTRTIAVKHGGFEKIQSDQDARERFQIEVFECIAKVTTGQNHFVIDRTPLDVLAYTTRYAQCAWMLREKLAASLSVLRMSIVFFVRPDPSVLTAAVKESERMKYLSQQAVHGLDGSIQTLLEMYNVPHIQIGGSDFSDRCRTVATTLHHCGLKANPESWSQPAEAVPKSLPAA